MSIQSRWIVIALFRLPPPSPPIRQEKFLQNIFETKTKGLRGGTVITKMRVVKILKFMCSLLI